MSSLVWLVHWTGRSVIVCVRNWAVAAHCGQDDLTRPFIAWSLADGLAVRIPLCAVDRPDLRTALLLARQRLLTLGSNAGVSWRQFGDITVDYHLYLAREHWLGNSVELRRQLIEETRVAENDPFLNRHLPQ